LALALDRHYRGDQSFALEREGKVIAAVWKATPHRRFTVTGGNRYPTELAPVYYHPVLEKGEDVQQVALGLASEESVMVSPWPLIGEGISESYAFRGDLWFRL